MLKMGTLNVLQDTKKYPNKSKKDWIFLTKKMAFSNAKMPFSYKSIN